MIFLTDDSKCRDSSSGCPTGALLDFPNFDLALLFPIGNLLNKVLTELFNTINLMAKIKRINIH